MRAEVWKYLSLILTLVLSLSIVSNALLYMQMGELEKYKEMPPSVNETTTIVSPTQENITILKLQIERLKREVSFLRSLLESENVTTANATIAVLPIIGPIDSSSALGIIKAIREIRGNDTIKGVLLWIESPGGYVGPVREIYNELKKLGYLKPIVAYVSGYAYSGAYYIACAAREIIAEPLSEVGSIGVIYVHFNAEEYYKMNGIEVEVFKTGPYKDMGADWRGLTPEERDIIKNEIQTYFNDFLEVVSEGRNMTINETKKFATGRAWFAKDVNGTLVDKLGDFDVALKELLKLIGAKKANVIILNMEDNEFEIGTTSMLYMPASQAYGYIRWRG
ncbi:signal peptide peptidase SppA [Pyrococcus abyssi]|uniref:Protease n=1 Tax=Pyrococcus abyssi (strain GE5 / Orsay) TaxID=272844 RepID=Q9V139_PYRAB|nr:signal peptide peptidase SppA [Pyrococcus abyssi]CAB49512.1 Putative protease [Pyrococcus abyssi GE5]CCE69982.1 TPA: putative protease [Pyrococcus abyssi GE5]